MGVLSSTYCIEAKDEVSEIGDQGTLWGESGLKDGNVT